MLIAKTLPLGLIVLDFGSLRETKVEDTFVEFTLWCEERTILDYCMAKESSSKQHPTSLVSMAGV